jgi:hypothetical protein
MRILKTIPEKVRLLFRNVGLLFQSFLKTFSEKYWVSYITQLFKYIFSGIEAFPQCLCGFYKTYAALFGLVRPWKCIRSTPVGSGNIWLNHILLKVYFFELTLKFPIKSHSVCVKVKKVPKISITSNRRNLFPRSKSQYQLVHRFILKNHKINIFIILFRESKKIPKSSVPLTCFGFLWTKEFIDNRREFHRKIPF